MPRKRVMVKVVSLFVVLKELFLKTKTNIFRAKMKHFESLRVKMKKTSNFKKEKYTSTEQIISFMHVVF